MILLHHQFVEEAGRGEGGECADGMCKHSSAPYPVEGLPAHAFGDLEQGMALAVVLHQG